MVADRKLGDDGGVLIHDLAERGALAVLVGRADELLLDAVEPDPVPEAFELGDPLFTSPAQGLVFHVQIGPAEDHVVLAVREAPSVKEDAVLAGKVANDVLERRLEVLLSLSDRAAWSLCRVGGRDRAGSQHRHRENGDCEYELGVPHAILFVPLSRFHPTPGRAQRSNRRSRSSGTIQVGRFSTITAVSQFQAFLEIGSSASLRGRIIALEQYPENFARMFAINLDLTLPEPASGLTLATGLAALA